DHCTHTRTSSLVTEYTHNRDLHSFPTRRSSDLCGLSERSRRASFVAAAQSQFVSITIKCENSASKLFGSSLSASFRADAADATRDRKSTRLNSSHLGISYAVFCLKKKKKTYTHS